MHFLFYTVLFLDSFQRAKEKLKRAETVTDVNTDCDELLAKKRRRITAAKHLNSSDSSEEEDSFTEFFPAFPPQPMVQQQSCGNNSAVKHYSKGDISCKKIITLMLLFTNRF